MKNNNLTKVDIIRELSKKTGFSFNFSKKLINNLVDILVNQIKSGQLSLKNLGTFTIINKNQRIGRNPKTKEKFIIEKRKSIRFKPSQKINQELKN